MPWRQFFAWLLAYVIITAIISGLLRLFFFVLKN